MADKAPSISESCSARMSELISGLDGGSEMISDSCS